MQRYKYLDGMRGVAALVVVISHFFQIFLPAAFSQTAPEHLWERSISTNPFNIALNGNFAVALFFVISGFVLSAPIFSGKGIPWYVNAAVRRYPRLAMPALASTVFAWLAAKTIGFHYASVIQISGAEMPDFFSSITSLREAVWQGSIGSFFFGQTNYNEVLWTIRTELIGSFMIFIAMPIIGRSRFRWIIYVLGFCIFFNSYLLGFVLGAACADIAINYRFNQSKWWVVVLLIGLYFGSYPYYMTNVSIWSPVNIMLHKNAFIVSHLLGGAMCVLAVSQLPLPRRFFESPLSAFFGRISYSLYLVHFTILGSLGTFLVALLITWQPYPLAIIESFILSIPVILIISVLFNRAIDEPVVYVTRKIYLFHKRVSPSITEVID